MPKVMVILMTLMLVLPSDGSSQAVPSPGDRIRIKQVDGTVFTGTFASWSPETVQLFVDSGRVEVPMARIEVLETSLGPSMSPKSVGIIVGAGGVIGAMIGSTVWEPCSFICFSPFESEHRSTAVLAGFGLGVLAVLPIGLLIRPERWNPASLPAPAASRLTIRPVISSRVGFAGSIRVGRF